VALVLAALAACGVKAWPHPTKALAEPAPDAGCDGCKEGK
jgi:hypothetical protein